MATRITEAGARLSNRRQSRTFGEPMNVMTRLTAVDRWNLLVTGLMGPRPGLFFEALRARGTLKCLLPELDALFGVPQLCDGPEPVDTGVHQLRLVDLTARALDPLEVRFAALVHKIGKAGTPHDMLPSHPGHEARGLALLDGLAQRLAVPGAALDLARLVISECDHVHRASDMRAGAIASLLERLQAQTRAERFEQLLWVCSCDYAAYPGHGAVGHPKVPRLRRAQGAAARADVAGLSPEPALHARAQAIAQALRG
ncbi:MAG: multifunctional CCA tRNA nucleotidyl transferase/2'3'-cyclic phosphodiesterase/2'nucleotidase/phosphatase, partial [Actinomycetota bacterium]|nr:multifunctional CCA tRNA nucleotidyl transferase/2'3'-cyclic phosphodiesterase/2'nucleotidase/phosphatase [Actinomycetota bacterium]